MRCFVGWILPNDLKERVWEISEKISKLPLKAKFVEKENLHINFSFLGEVSEDKINLMYKDLEKLCSETRVIKIFVGGVKPIPSEKRIRVIAIDVLSTELENFMRKIIGKIGGKNKPPHITLCRVKKVEDKEMITIAKKFGIFDEFYIKKVQVIESVLRRDGPTYKVLREFDLINSVTTPL